MCVSGSCPPWGRVCAAEELVRGWVPVSGQRQPLLGVTVDSAVVPFERGDGLRERYTRREVEKRVWTWLGGSRAQGRGRERFCSFSPVLVRVESSGRGWEDSCPPRLNRPKAPGS